MASLCGNKHQINVAHGVSLVSGQLYLRNRKCKNSANAPMCGAELITSNSFRTFKHGRIEARVKIPGNADGFSAFWLLGNGTGDQSWPKTGEIDIFEFVNNGKENGIPFFTVHWYGTNCPSKQCQKTISPTPVANYTKDFHVWSFTRNANEINVSIDGKLWSRITRQELAAIGGNYDVIFNEPMHLRLDLSSGGVWANDPLRNAEEGDLIFDYVRVWSDAN
jgi:beta-glucanase (GH16 family)